MSLTQVHTHSANPDSGNLDDTASPISIGTAIQSQSRHTVVPKAVNLDEKLIYTLDAWRDLPPASDTAPDTAEGLLVDTTGSTLLLDGHLSYNR